MRAKRITATAGGLLVLALAASGLAASAGETSASETPAAVPTVPDARTVTLITGDRVRLATVTGGRMVASLEPGPDEAAGSAPDGAASGPVTPRRVRTMTVADRMYVVPDTAMPYVGRELDLALFDVTAPPSEVEVVWRPGVAPRPVPGLDPVPGPERETDTTTAGAVTTARVSEPAAFGAVLGSPGAAGRARPLAGVRSIRPASEPAAADPPTADPAYPQATLVVKGVDALGAPAFSGGVSVSNADDVLRFGSMRSFVEGEVAFSVPVGTYSLSADITTFTADGQYVSDALLVMPQIEVAAPQTVITADARVADTRVPVPTTPKPAVGQQMQLTYGRTADSGTISTTSYMLIGGSPRMLVTPTEPVTVGEVHWYTYFHLASPADAAEPYVYDLHLPADGVVPQRFAAAVDESSLARIDAAYHAEEAPHAINVHRSSFAPWEGMPFRATSSATAPLRRIEYVSALPDVGWVGVVNWRPAEGRGFVQGPLTVYRRGEKRPDAFLGAPLVPGAATGTTDVQPCAVCRQGEVLALHLYPWKDPGGHTVDQLGTGGTLQAGAQAQLYVDGALHGMPGLPQGSITVPAAEADYRLELTATKSASWTTTATRTATVWRWRSAERTGSLPPHLVCADGGTACAAEPLLLVAYDTPVGLDNALPRESTVGLRVARQDGAGAPAASVSFDVSADDGQTWQPAAVRAQGSGRFAATVTAPAGAQFLSFRVRATDPQGNAVEQTVTRAVRVAAE